jgi:hypothetical protein
MLTGCFIFAKASMNKVDASYTETLVQVYWIINNYGFWILDDFKT